MSLRVNSGSPLPTKVVSQMESTHHNTTHTAADVSDQVEILTPVFPHVPSQATYATLNGHSKTPSEVPQADTSIHASPPGVSRLVPPVGQIPMSFPTRIPPQPPKTRSSLPQEKHKQSESDASDVPGLAPPVSRKVMDTPAMPSLSEVPADEVMSIQPRMTMNPQPVIRAAYDTSRPTCSMNLVCYRGGSGGCILRQMQTALESRFSSKEAFEKMINKDSKLIATDANFFRELRCLYEDMSGFWRRYFSLKTLRGLRILAVS